jgi:hypothetical protein
VSGLADGTGAGDRTVSGLMVPATAARGWERVVTAGEQCRSRRSVDLDLKRAARGTTFSELPRLPEAELVARYDRLARSEALSFIAGAEQYLTELTRRETDRQSGRPE